MKWHEVDRIASRQDGLVAGRQLVGLGLSRSAIARAARTARLIRVEHDVFRLPGTPGSWRQTVRQKVLAVGDPVGASHLTCLALGEVLERPPTTIELTVPWNRRLAIDGAIVHRTRRWPAKSLPEVAGIPVLPVERAIVDLSGRFSSRQLGRWIDEGRRRELLTVEAVERCRLEIGVGRSRRLRRVDDATALRRTAGPGVNDREVDVLQRIVDAGLEIPEQNARVLIDGIEYELDLAYRDRRIGIEFDGWQHHQKRDRFDLDREKDRRFVAAGWVILRATSATNWPELIGQVATLLRTRPII